jgi:hypothetical protein
VQASERWGFLFFDCACALLFACVYTCVPASLAGWLCCMHVVLADSLNSMQGGVWTQGTSARANVISFIKIAKTKDTLRLLTVILQA